MGLFSKPEVISPGGDGRASDADRARIAELEGRVARLELQLAQLARTGDGSSASSPAPQEAWLADVQALHASGRTIHAIKLYRERTGCGLKQAKDAVEAMPV